MYPVSSSMTSIKRYRPKVDPWFKGEEEVNKEDNTTMYVEEMFDGLFLS